MALQYCKRIFQYHFTEYFLYPVSSHNKDVSQRDKDTRQQPYCICQQPYQTSLCRAKQNILLYLSLIFTQFLRTQNCEDSLRGYSSFGLKAHEWTRIRRMSTNLYFQYLICEYLSKKKIRAHSPPSRNFVGQKLFSSRLKHRNRKTNPQKVVPLSAK